MRTEKKRRGGSHDDQIESEKMVDGCGKPLEPFSLDPLEWNGGLRLVSDGWPQARQGESLMLQWHQTQGEVLDVTSGLAKVGQAVKQTSTK